jgi:hypothetical protein
VLEHGKWEAWNRVRRMSQQQAIQAYNSVAGEILSAGVPLSQPEVYIHVRRPGESAYSPSNLSTNYRLPVVV